MRNSRKLFLFFTIILAFLLFFAVTVNKYDYFDISIKDCICSSTAEKLLLNKKEKLHDAVEIGVVPDVLEAQKKCIMTVFIHGTVGPRFSITMFFKWLKNMLKGKRRNCGAYQEYIEESKRVSLHRFQPIGDLGLVKIDLCKEIPKKDFCYFGKQTAVFYEKIRRCVCYNDQSDVIFYTFGWSGRLCGKHRRAEALKLYDAILAEKDRLAKEKKLPVEVHLLAHSHGCNVVLNLDSAEKEREEELCIDKAVFFGGPVQSETEELVKSKVFKRIYHVFSEGDFIQRLDFVSTKDRFSRRIFGTNKKKTFKLPKNLLQMNVELAKYHPFHYELWLWGRKRFPYFLYRKRVPTHPIPLAVFTPIIIALADSVDWDAAQGNICDLKFDTKKSSFLISDGNKTFSRYIDIQTIKEEAFDVL